MTAPSWLDDAECRRRGIPVTEFVPPEGKPPSARALAACSACPVAGPCGATRGRDIGLRGDGFLGGRHGERGRRCEDCGQMWIARGGAYKRCPECSAARKREGAA